MHRTERGRDYIALALAIGICTALNMLVFAVVFDAVYNHRPGQLLQGNGGLGENTTQILTGWGGGILGILGAVFGYKAGQAGADAARSSLDQLSQERTEALRKGVTPEEFDEIARRSEVVRRQTIENLRAAKERGEDEPPPTPHPPASVSEPPEAPIPPNPA